MTAGTGPARWSGSLFERIRNRPARRFVAEEHPVRLDLEGKRTTWPPSHRLPEHGGPPSPATGSWLFKVLEMADSRAAAGKGLGFRKARIAPFTNSGAGQLQ